ncbi:MAG TPA: transglycosylase domain-containing protein [Acidobacteriaceae bacterium]|nr:transglycosylase domain-containing protein [Acidobacteriaceae bacterium]
MAVKIKLPRWLDRDGHGIRNSILFVVLTVLFVAFAVFGSIFGYYYVTYEHVVDLRLQKPLFENTAKVYAAPKEVRVGQKLTAEGIAEELHEAGYSEGGNAAIGTYTVDGTNSIAIHPGPQSYHSQQGAVISFNKGLVRQISGDDGEPLGAYELEPELITGLFGADRTKRKVLTYDELGPNMVNAVVSIEDRRFFEHGGVDYIRLLGALRDDLLSGRKAEGGSTLTMQLAKNFFLTPEKRFKRKMIEIAITFQLEHRFTKQQIFAMYANEISLGQVGSFAIHGFGQAAQTYFGKDVNQLDVAQCALLAGLVQDPSLLNPYRHKDRALHRRNQVLDAMVENHKLSRAEAEQAKAEPVHLTPANVDAGEAPYFVDLVRERLVQQFGNTDFNADGYRIYTSLDPELQNAATQAVDEGMRMVDEQVEKLHARRVKAGDKSPIVYPQVALIALNPHTGQVLALVGGRNYGASQLDHAIASRPMGSSFKPFVFAAAFNSSLAGTVLSRPASDVPANAPKDVASADPVAPPPPDPSQPASVFNAVMQLDNEPTTFEGGYSPHNFETNRYNGMVTARLALQLSLNNASIELAQMVGYDNVAKLGRDAGIKSARATPSVALGTYGATPLDAAGAYTVFANGGVKIDPWMVASIRNANGDVLTDYAPNSKSILDPRVAYLTLSLMESVVNGGTASKVRALGFSAPAAGKTGTENDSWFDGFTSNLLCIVWVGNDDYTDLKIQGADGAVPIWANFMKRAVQLPQYSDTEEFPVPSGVSLVKVDKVTGLLADAACPDDYTIAFLDGTAPTDTCDRPNFDQRNVFQKLLGIGKQPALPPAPPPQLAGQPNAPAANPTSQPNPSQQEDDKKKKGFFGKIFGAIKGDDNKQNGQSPQN